MTKHIITIAALALLLSCNNGSESYSTNEYPSLEKQMDYDSMEDQEINPPITAEPPTVPVTTDVLLQNERSEDKQLSKSKAQKIIKNGRISVDVDGIKKAKSTLDEKIKSLDGYYESESFEDGYNIYAYHLTIRVPTDGFEKLTGSLDDGFGRITSKEINAKDVTEEYVDLGIRLESKLVALAAYQRFLKKATNVKEILQVQNEIRRIEEEIESKKGKLRYLDDQVSYSTLRIDLVEHRPVVAQVESRHFWAQMKNAFIHGYDGALNVAIAIAYVWPLWLMLGGLAFLFRKKKWSFRKKKAII